MPFLPTEPSNYATLSAMITPAIFLSATGSLIISTSNRMSRVVDRIRVLNDRGDEMCRGDAQRLDFLEDRQEHVVDQLRRLEGRSDRVRYALSLLYLSLSMFVGTSLMLAVDSAIGVHRLVGAIATLLSVAGVTLMLMASVNLVLEAQAALTSNRLEIKFYRELQARRIASNTCAK